MIGYHGTAAFDWYAGELTVHHHMSGRVERHHFDDDDAGHHGGDRELAHDFLLALSGGGPIRAPLAAGIASARLCLAARDACRTGLLQDILPTPDVVV